MLLPGNRRLVLEVDDMQRYPHNEGTEPGNTKYTATMAGDRALKFRGYEVFRFGHDELRDRDRAQPLLAGFFATLLDRSPTAHRPVRLGCRCPLDPDRGSTVAVVLPPSPAMGWRRESPAAG
ncbi:hypothetical protein [Streptomyces sp. NPDC086989]|uniref:hypothetical protein n=1 Tax=Streptomyces sp. NPDC086989 TaxID=3365764 RepID=UPI0038074375